MSQLDNVLRRSIAHIDPADWQGRDRVFASAREAMIRLLRVYDPPLSADDIDRKIKEFDDVIGAIEVEYRWARPLGDTLALAPPRRPAAPVLAALPPPEEDEADEEDEGAAVDTGSVDEADELYADDPDDEDYDDYEDYDGDEYPFDGDDEPRGGLFGLIDRIGWRMIAAVIGAVVIVGLAGSALLVMGHGSGKTTASSPETPAVIDTAAPASSAPPPQASPAFEPPATETAAAQPQPEAQPVAPGGLALETLVLFDGRDPGVFQSTSDNPVVFQGDQDGGFARVSSSTTSAGARVRIGRGVYERIAGHRIRIVLVARASRTAPAMNVRFAYQNGRVQSPWSEVKLGSSYTPLSAEWTAPPERGGPENDSLIIEPGIPGDGTSIDVRSVRIEVLG